MRRETAGRPRSPSSASGRGRRGVAARGCVLGLALACACGGDDAGALDAGGSDAGALDAAGVDAGGVDAAGSDAGTMPPPPSSGAPRLFFSDLLSGPKAGWEGSATQGVAVTVWGLGLGATRGSSYVTVNGAQLRAAGDYAEWGAVGPARGLERITFWLSADAAGADGSITVTVDGEASNALPFTVREGRIYFVSPSGSNMNDGAAATDQGGGHGPWADFYMADFYSNALLQDGDVVYVRSGVYTSTEAGSSFAMHVRDRSCTAALPCAIVGYPGDALPVVDTPGTEIYQEFSGGTRTDYWVVAKLRFQNGGDALHTSGDGWRVVGCAFEGYQEDAWTGVIKPVASDDARYLGLLFKDSGYDYYKHAINPTCHSGGSDDRPITHLEIGWNEVDHWIGDLGTADHLGGAVFNFRDNSDTNIISGVYVHDCYMHDSPSGQLFYNEEEADDIYLYDNLVVGTNQSGTSTARYSLHLEAQGGTRRFYVFNNTFYDSASSAMDTSIIGARGHSGAMAEVFSSNNLYVNTDSAASYLYNNHAGGSVIHSVNDLFFGAGDPAVGAMDGDFDFTSVLTGLDPLFVDAAGHDFRLQAASPAVDAGASDARLTGVVTRDYMGVSRPRRAGYDIGAYEYDP